MDLDEKLQELENLTKKIKSLKMLGKSGDVPSSVETVIYYKIQLLTAETRAKAEELRKAVDKQGVENFVYANLGIDIF